MNEEKNLKIEYIVHNTIEMLKKQNKSFDDEKVKGIFKDLFNISFTVNDGVFDAIYENEIKNLFQGGFPNNIFYDPERNIVELHDVEESTGHVLYITISPENEETSIYSQVLFYADEELANQETDPSYKSFLLCDYSYQTVYSKYLKNEMTAESNLNECLVYKYDDNGNLTSIEQSVSSAIEYFKEDQIAQAKELYFINKMNKLTAIINEYANNIRDDDDTYEVSDKYDEIRELYDKNIQRRQYLNKMINEYRDIDHNTIYVYENNEIVNTIKFDANKKRAN